MRSAKAQTSTAAHPSSRWGEPPWEIDFVPEPRALPEEVDIAILGAGFTGLAAAAWLRSVAPEKTVAVLEARRIGAGASGRTGGIALGETAAGDLPGLGDVLEGYARILEELEVECELRLDGAWEIARRSTRADSPILWHDSGTLRLANEVPGGSVHPGKLVSGLARAACSRGAILAERVPVRSVAFGQALTLELPQGRLRTRQALFATNAQALALSGLAGRTQPKFTLAVATAPLEEDALEAIGLRRGKPFYTLDLPYLWGRVLPSRGVVFGSGLVHLEDSEEFDTLDIASGAPAALVAALERRVRGLHAALGSVEFTHRWGGPILFGNSWRPVFAPHPRAPESLTLGAYSGHGVALSVYLARWAAEVLLGEKQLPAWGRLAP